ncbi:TetR/AcrR family transcriptional regulator [Streptomyces sp. NPDC050523]|uniref:TetR/AcrR family transcriptional regulator n=1 Tax=Streptomyces sp. NPDC050523 TaxID=3365622 RepID=UPI00378E28BE
MAATAEQAPEVPPLIWAEPEPDGALLRPPLTRAQVVAALLRIADAEGLAAVSAERLTTELGAAGASLRHHIRRPGDLEDLLLDGVFGELTLTQGESGTWRADLRAGAQELRRAIGRHPWFARLTFRRPLFGPRALSWLEHMMAVLEGAGLEVTVASAYAGIVTGHVMGTAMCEAEEKEMERVRAGDRSTHERHFDVTSFLDGIVAGGRYPAFSRFLQAGARHLTADESFEIGLDALLDGLARRIERIEPA